MKKLVLILLLFLFLLPTQLRAAVTSVGTLGTATSKTSNTTLALTPTNQLDSGNCGVLVIALDNTNTTDGNFTEVSTVVDTASNSYTKMREFTNGQGAAAAGATVSIWTTKATSNLPITGTLTVTFANTITAKAASFWEFTCGRALQVASGGTADLATDGAASPGSMTVSGLPSKEYLFFRGAASESDSIEAWTATANFTNITFTGTTGAPFAGNMRVRGEFRILTGTTSTSNPNDTVSPVSDWASTFLALEEAPAGCPPTLARMGVGC